MNKSNSEWGPKKEYRKYKLYQIALAFLISIFVALVAFSYEKGFLEHYGLYLGIPLILLLVEFRANFMISHMISKLSEDQMDELERYIDDVDKKLNKNLLETVDFKEKIKSIWKLVAIILVWIVVVYGGFEFTKSVYFFVFQVSLLIGILFLGIYEGLKKALIIGCVYLGTGSVLGVIMWMREL